LKPWKSLTKPIQVEIVSPEGETRSKVEAFYTGSMFIVEDIQSDVRAGDEIRRKLPNGNDEVFLVEDPKLYEETPFGPHYQISVSRPNIRPPRTDSSYTIHLSGENARVNINSTDASTNVVKTDSLFNQARQIIAQSNINEARSRELNQHIEAMETAKSQTSFSAAYQAFIASAADHIAVFSPILSGFALALASLPTA